MSKNTKTEKQLEAEGWKLATVTAGTHLKRTIEMYTEMNIPTYLFEVDAHECGECTSCYGEAGETIYRIYIKPQAE